MPHFFEHSPKTVLITGASQDIGRATALLAAQKGYMVVVNYAQNTAAAEETVARILAAGGRAIAMQADISQEAAVVRLFRQIDSLAVVGRGLLCHRRFRGCERRAVDDSFPS